MHKNGDEMVLVRDSNYFFAVCGSDKEAARLAGECCVTGQELLGDVYEQDYIGDTLGMGYTDYGAEWRNLIGNQENPDTVFLTYGADIDDLSRRVLVCGSYTVACEVLAEETGKSIDEIVEESSRADAYEIRIMEVELNKIYDSLDIDVYDVASLMWRAPPPLVVRRAGEAVGIGEMQARMEEAPASWNQREKEINYEQSG